MKTLRLYHLYPREMNTYADRGNVAVLDFRLKWRDLKLEVTELGLGENLDSSTAKNVDLIYLGGGQDIDQEIVAADLLKTKADGIRDICHSGGVGLFICGGYQLAGHSYETNQKKLPGMAILDVYTRQALVSGAQLSSFHSHSPAEKRKNGENKLAKRLTGNIHIQSNIEGKEIQILGYENHAGRTYLLKDEAQSGISPDNDPGTDNTNDKNQFGKTRALGEVISGHGNNGEDKTEGAIANKVIGTYIHGPLLPKNPELADLLIAWGMQRRYGKDFQLPKIQIDSKYVKLARSQALKS